MESTFDLMNVALAVAQRGRPVLPLAVGKLPFGNCGACQKSRCGDRPNMLKPGPCRCPRPCHGWAAATTDPRVITSPHWAAAWRRAEALAYHPGGAGLTVLDLDNADAVAWAREHLPATLTVATTRGEHWLYRGAMRSRNSVRPGIDIKSTMAYARWLGPGIGAIAALPDAVRALAAKEPAPVRPAAQVNVVPPGAAGRQCRHRTPAYLDRGIDMAEQRITEAREAIHNTVYRTFLAVLSAHGRCGCLTDAHVARLFTAAQAKGESPRHCTDAWANARSKLGL
ncbi:hypothetical protein ABH931_005539 [Streptacidiphilus sp. MAP12-33]|uniref:bifunctional DNA primase/polymerase n=1 Tax=Streptacidiphilus sp. MAP12-33 TaxID=3156266 RepID=UPI0035157FDB